MNKSNRVHAQIQDFLSGEAGEGRRGSNVFQGVGGGVSKEIHKTNK